MRTNLDFTAPFSQCPLRHRTRFICGGCHFSLCVPLFFVSHGKDYLESAAACKRLNDKDAGRRMNDNGQDDEDWDGDGNGDRDRMAKG